MQLARLTLADLTEYTCRQLEHFFPDGIQVDRNLVARQMPVALQRLEYCINHVRLWAPGRFDHLHSTQYCLYLYYLANTLWRNSGDVEVPTRLFLLNKLLNGIDCFYEIEMPNVFFIGHSAGIVLAKAHYSDFLVLYQNSTVGKNHGIAPELAKGVVMYPNTAIIGRCKIGPGTVLSQGVGVVNCDTPGNCLVFRGAAERLVFKEPKRDVLNDLFRL
jgi:serine O-acetyltransferase